MPQSDPAARRYADAVFGIAHDTASHDRWLDDLADIGQLFSEPTVYGFLISTRVSQADKEQVLDNALPDLQSNARNFAKLLVRKRRANLAAQIVDAFRERLNSVRGIAEANVTTAVPLSNEARTAVAEAVRRYTQRRHGHAVRNGRQPDHRRCGRADWRPHHRRVRSYAAFQHAPLVGSRLTSAHHTEGVSNMAVRPEEVAAIIRQQIEGFESQVVSAEVGTVVEAGDGIARVLRPRRGALGRAARVPAQGWLRSRHGHGAEPRRGNRRLGDHGRLPGDRRGRRSALDRHRRGGSGWRATDWPRRQRAG